MAGRTVGGERRASAEGDRGPMQDIAIRLSVNGIQPSGEALHRMSRFRGVEGGIRGGKLGPAFSWPSGMRKEH